MAGGKQNASTLADAIRSAAVKNVQKPENMLAITTAVEKELSSSPNLKPSDTFRPTGRAFTREEASLLKQKREEVIARMVRETMEKSFPDERLFPSEDYFNADDPDRPSNPRIAPGAPDPDLSQEKLGVRIASVQTNDHPENKFYRSGDLSVKHRDEADTIARATNTPEIGRGDKTKNPNPLNGDNAGVIALPKVKRYADTAEMVHQRIIARMPQVVEALLDSAEGLYVEEEKEDGRTGETMIRRYRKEPNVKAAQYVMDRILGKPTQPIEGTGLAGAPNNNIKQQTNVVVMLPHNNRDKPSHPTRPTPVQVSQIEQTLKDVEEGRIPIPTAYDRACTEDYAGAFADPEVARIVEAEFEAQG